MQGSKRRTHRVLIAAPGRRRAPLGSSAIPRRAETKYIGKIGDLIQPVRLRRHSMPEISRHGLQGGRFV